MKGFHLQKMPFSIHHNIKYKRKGKICLELKDYKLNAKCL